MQDSVIGSEDGCCCLPFEALSLEINLTGVSVPLLGIRLSMSQNKSLRAVNIDSGILCLKGTRNTWRHSIWRSLTRFTTTFCGISTCSSSICCCCCCCRRGRGCSCLILVIAFQKFITFSSGLFFYAA